MEEQITPRRGRPPKAVIVEEPQETVAPAESLKRFHGFIRVMVPSVGQETDDISVDNGELRTVIPRNMPIVVPAHAIVPLIESRLPAVEEVDRFQGVAEKDIPAGVTRKEFKIEDKIPTYPGINLQIPDAAAAKRAEAIFREQDHAQAKQIYDYFVKLGYLQPGYEMLLG